MKGSKKAVSEEIVSNSEWANVMKNILSMDKPKSKNSMILSRAEKLDPKLEKEDHEDDDHPANKISAQALIKKEWLARGRYKPNSSEEGERERKLRRVAVAGVVQLFNAVGKHQQANSSSTVNTAKTISSTSSSTSFKAINKKSFFNILLGKNEMKEESPSERGLGNLAELEVKEEEDIKEETQECGEPDSKWDVLRNDFMMSTKLKDWDKQMDNDST